jgi:PAS domain S-box-containing protein
MALEIADLKTLWLDLRAQVDELAAARQQYLDFFQQSPEAYVVTDAAGTITDANGAATDILQRRKNYLRGKPLVVLVALERRTEFRSRLRKLAQAEPGAVRSWRTVLEAPELRTEVTVSARPIDRGEGVGGICWRLEVVQ